MTTTDDRAARLRALGWTDEELRILEISDRAEGYRPAHGEKDRRRERAAGGRTGRKPQPITPEQAADALRLRAQGWKWSRIGAFLHISDRRLERELAARSHA